WRLGQESQLVPAGLEWDLLVEFHFLLSTGFEAGQAVPGLCGGPCGDREWLVAAAHFSAPPATRHLNQQPAWGNGAARTVIARLGNRSDRLDSDLRLCRREICDRYGLARRLVRFVFRERRAVLCHDFEDVVARSELDVPP